jgi:hypothetical protein
MRIGQVLVLTDQAAQQFGKRLHLGLEDRVGGDALRLGSEDEGQAECQQQQGN